MSRSRPLRIVLVLQDLNDHGANRVSLDRAARWQRRGDEVTVFVVMHEPERTRLPVPRGVRLHRATARPAQLRTALPAAAWRLLRLAAGCDVVVAGTETGLAVALARVVARSTGRPFSVTVQSHPGRALHEHVEPWLRPTVRRALVAADLAVCVGEQLVPVLAELGLPVERSVVVTNAVPRDELRAAATAAPAVPLPHDAAVVVASGRLVHQKGFDLLVRAHARALALGAPAHELVVLGEGEDRAALERLADELGVAGSVALPGFQAEPHAVVARADVFVLSSRWEGFGLVLAEALACGTPCIAFDCASGPRQVLGGGAYGRLVPPEDVEALAQALVDHLREPAALRARAALLHSSDELFDPAASAARHRDALADLARRARLSRAVSAPPPHAAGEAAVAGDRGPAADDGRAA